jgi:hypothetical protein
MTTTLMTWTVLPATPRAPIHRYDSPFAQPRFLDAAMALPLEPIFVPIADMRWRGARVTTWGRLPDEDTDTATWSRVAAVTLANGRVYHVRFAWAPDSLDGSIVVRCVKRGTR